MSFTEDGGPAQPEQGQGGGDASNPMYAEYLDRISDPEARSVAEEGFRSFDQSAQKKFTEAAEYKKAWEPFDQLGIRQQDPQTVAWAMQLATAAQQDPQAFYEWVNGDYAGQYGLGQQQQPDQFDGFEDPNAALTQRIEQLEQMLQGVDGRFEQQAQQQAQQEALQMIEGQIAEIQKTAGDGFDRQALEMVLPHFTDQAKTREELEQAVPRAWEALQGLLNKREQQAFNGKLNQPRGPESSGMPDVSPQKVHTLKEAHAQAMDIARRGLM